MTESDELDLLGEVGKRIHSILEETFSGVRSSLFDLDSRSLRPLYRIEATDDELTVTFDLPGVEKEEISLTSTEFTLSIEAKMRKVISLKIGGPFQKDVQFEKYAKQIRLPVRVDPNKAKAKFRNGLLTIKFPLAPGGNSVRIL